MGKPRSLVASCWRDYGAESRFNGRRVLRDRAREMKPTRTELEEAFSGMHTRFGGERVYLDRVGRKTMFAEIPPVATDISEIRELIQPDGWTYEGVYENGKIHKFCRERLTLLATLSPELSRYEVVWATQSDIWDFCPQANHADESKPEAC